jgi:RimJ/RimL family protein N-acetyltransferase
METKLSLGPLLPPADPAGLPGPGPLTGRHVHLELLDKIHFPDLYDSLCSDKSLWQWWPDEPPSTRAAFDDYLNGIDEHMGEDLATWAVCPTTGSHKGKALGILFTLSEDRETHRTAELGALFGPHLQRSTAATESFYLAADHMFGLNHRRLAWKTNSLNTASRRAAERWGFTHEGTFRQHQINKGRNRDSAFYAIIDSEWPVCKKALELWLDDSNFDERQHQRKKLESIRESLI